MADNPVIKKVRNILSLRSLRTRLTLIIIGLALGPLIITGLVLSWHIYRAQERQAMELERETVQRVSIEVDSFVRELVSKLNSALDALSIVDMPQKHQKTIMANLLADNYYFDSLTLVDNRGRELIRLHRLEMNRFNRNTDLSERPEFTKPINSGKTYYGSVRFDHSSGEPSMFISVPQVDQNNGNAQRILIALTRWKKIWNLFALLPTRQGERVYLLDQDGRLIAHRNPSLVLKNTLFHLPEREGFSRGIDGRRVLLAYNRINWGNQTFYVVAEQSLGAAFSLAIDTLTIIGGLFFALTAIAVALIVLVVGKVIRPVQILASAARRIEAGDLDGHVEITDENEMGDLGLAFNNMTTRLRTTLKNLELEVRERRIVFDSLKISEEKFRSAFDYAGIGMALVGLDGGFISVNSFLLDILGYTEPELIAQKINLVIFPEDWETHDDLFRNLSQNDSGRYQIEIRFQHKLGQVVWGILNVSLVRIQAGHPEYSIFQFTDITRWKNAEIEKERLETQLRQSKKMEAIGTLAGGVAHDFNNLLQAINGYTQLMLLDRSKDDPDYSNLMAIQKTGDRAAQLVRQLLQFSRRGDSERKFVNLNTAVEHARRILERTIPKMIDIQLLLGRGLWSVKADPVQMEQILLNLGTNAADAMPDGGRLTFETENVVLDMVNAQTLVGAEPGQYVMISVTDTGIGMDKETLGHIFEPFYTTKDIGKGTGLGLASVYGIVKSHDGYITCRSEPGYGAVFTMYFPATETRAVQEESPPETPVEGGIETLLLVDDENHVREFASRALERFGYTVLTACNGEEALKVYSERNVPIHLVILDIGMPGMGGYRCLNELLEIDPSAKILIASGYSVDGQVRKALDSGARGFVPKPYEIQTILNKVRAILNDNNNIT